MGRKFNTLVYNNQYYIYGFKISKELYSKIKYECDMWNKETQRLQQENQQLKEQLEKKYEKVGTLTNEILYEENTKLLSVLDEIREYINNENYKDENICIVDGIEILQILDKVGKE